MPSSRSLLLLLLLVAQTLHEYARQTFPDELVTFYDEAAFDDMSKKDPVKATFFLSRFAQAEFEPKCHEEAKPIIVPVHFHAGGTVELPCKACEWAHVVNGLPKTWRHIPLHEATAFLVDPSKFLHDFREDEAKMQSLYRSLKPEGGGFHRRAHLLKKMYRDDANDVANDDGVITHRHGPPPQRHASIHHFVQADGRLYIHGTMLESSGIYFCSDKQSYDAHTRVFFLLTAMAPLVYHSSATGKPNIASVWNVDDWLTSGHKSEAACEPVDDDSTVVPMPDEYAHMRYSPAAYPETAEALEKMGTVPRPLLISIGRDGDDTNLEVDLEYGEWTACRKDERIQYREAHCVLKRKAGKTIPDFASTPWLKWATELNAYFDRLGSLRFHSYFLTSLIYKGHTYGSETDEVACDERKNLLWDAFKRALLPTSIGIKYEDFEEAIKPENWKGEASLLLGLGQSLTTCYEVALKSSENWWSIRGISFIQKQACPTQG